MTTKPTLPTGPYYPQILLELIATKWSIPVIYSLQHGLKRYSEIHRLLPDVTQKVLTDTLRKLERSGVVARTVYNTSPPKVEYRLTELGYELLIVIDNMARWAETNHQKITRAQKAYDKDFKDTRPC